MCDRAGRGEVALVGEVGTLADVASTDQLGDQEIDVGIALAVAVRAHVDRHAVDVDGKIGAVVEIEAAQEVLVGFALAAVLGDDEAGRRFQHLADAQRRNGIDLRAGHRQLARGFRGWCRGRGLRRRGRRCGPHRLDRRHPGRPDLRLRRRTPRRWWTHRRQRYGHIHLDRGKRQRPRQRRWWRGGGLSGLLVRGSLCACRGRYRHTCGHGECDQARPQSQLAARARRPSSPLMQRAAHRPPPAIGRGHSMGGPAVASKRECLPI